MDIRNPKIVIGTNSWGTAGYEKIMRGSSVGYESFCGVMEQAKANDLAIFDTARDYGNGKCEKMIGEMGTKDICISAKYTPFTRYKKGQVTRSFEKDLADLKRDYIDIYWLHMPNDIEANLSEFITLYRQGKILHIGVSNFNLKECKLAKSILDREQIPLYGVQNHYSILCRDWEKNGLLDWCKKNGVLFWAWSSMEGGVLAGPGKVSGLFGMFGGRKVKKFTPLYEEMDRIGKRHGLSNSQVAVAYCIAKGIVPMCGCRRPNRVAELAVAAQAALEEQEISAIDYITEQYGFRNMGSDVFRFAVRKHQ